jgi:tetratricopeptide (TPR) repeat protein
MRAAACRPAVAAFLAVALAGAAANATDPGAVVPFFKAADLQGHAVSLGDLVARRRVAVLFWDWRRATSTRAMQVFDRLQQAYGKQGFEVVAVEGEGASAEQVLERVEKLRAIGTALGFTIVPDPGGRIARQFRVEETPEIFLLDGAGRVSFHLEGFRAEDETALVERVREALGLATPSAPRRPSQTPEPPPAAADAAAPAPAEKPADPTAALLERYRYFGNFNLNRGEPGKAEEYYRRYVELAPNDADIWLHLGEACARQRRYDQAREAWEQVLRIEPGNREADASIRRMIRGEY